MLEATHAAKIKHVPLLYFNYTEMLKTYEPVQNAIPLIFIHLDKEDFLLDTVFNSFSQFMDNSRHYDLLVLSKKITPMAMKSFNSLFDKFKNLSVRYIDYDLIKNQLDEHYGIEMDISALIPFILKKYEKVLVFSTNILFNGSIVNLWDENKNEQSLICAPKDCYMQGRIKDLNSSTAEDILTQFLKNPLDYYNLNAMVMNLERFRSIFNIEDVVNISKEIKSKRISMDRFPFLTLNTMCQKKIKTISQKWGAWTNSSLPQKFYLPKATLETFSEYNSVKNSPAIFCYEYSDIFSIGNEVFDFYFWETAKKSASYAQLLYRLAGRITNNTFIRESLGIHLKNIFKRGMKCYKENGFIYTSKRFLRKLRHKYVGL